MSLGERLVRHMAASSAPPQRLPALSLSSALEPFFSPTLHTLFSPHTLSSYEI
jgi:hypothetical protein